MLDQQRQNAVSYVTIHSERHVGFVAVVLREMKLDNNSVSIFALVKLIKEIRE